MVACCPRKVKEPPDAAVLAMEQEHDTRRLERQKDNRAETLQT